MNQTVGSEVGPGLLASSTSNPQKLAIVAGPPYKKSQSLRPYESKKRAFATGSPPQRKQNVPKYQKRSNNVSPRDSPQGSGFLPSAFQTLPAAQSPDLPKVGGAARKDTRPAFLGGPYKSKVQGRSEVAQYLNHRRGKAAADQQPE